MVTIPSAVFLFAVQQIRHPRLIIPCLLPCLATRRPLPDCEIREEETDVPKTIPLDGSSRFGRG